VPRPDPPLTTHRAIEAVWRIEAARLIAGLGRLVRDIGQAEELAQDALVAALEQWPASGVPDNPGAWLMAVAKRRAIDQIRRRERFERKQEEIGRDLETSRDPSEDDFDAVLDSVEGNISDDMLRLVFTACHPVLSTEARVALTLRVLGGLTTTEIARAFLVPESTVSQRIVRAKKTLAKAGVQFEARSATSWPPGCPRCSRWSTWCSTRATRRPPATTGCARRCVRTRCASAGSWPSWCPVSRRRTGWWR